MCTYPVAAILILIASASNFLSRRPLSISWAEVRGLRHAPTVFGQGVVRDILHGQWRASIKFTDSGLGSLREENGREAPAWRPLHGGHCPKALAERLCTLQRPLRRVRFTEATSQRPLYWGRGPETVAFASWPWTRRNRALKNKCQMSV